MKKLVTLMLALLMVLTMAPMAMAEEELPVVTFFTADNGSVEYPLSFEDRPVLAKIVEIARERFGIELKLETCIPSEYKTILSTRLASGNDLPDLIRVDGNFSSADMIGWYDQGLILDLDQFEIPNYRAALESYPGVKANTQDADGHMLAMAQIVVNPQHVTNWAVIRHDWLEELGLEVPTNTDEFYEVLKAFQENDMNGDGLPNEVWQGNYAAMNLVMYPAFGEGMMNVASNSWGIDADGKVYCTMTTQEAKEYVAYMNKLWSEGLIWDSSFSSYTSEEFTQMQINNQISGTFSMFWDGLLWDTSMNAYGLKAGYAPMKPLDEKITVLNYSGGLLYVITSSCKAPEKVAEFLDWFYTTEGTQISYYGEAAPGGEYFVRDTSKYDSLGLNATEYEMVGTDKYFEELANEISLNTKLGANSCWPEYMPGYADQVAADFYFSYDADACGLNCDVNYVVDTLNWAMENGTYAPLFAASSTEQANIISKHGDLFDYMNEQMKGFISGSISLDEWDAYVAECENMGMAEVIEVMQARYDAANA